MSDVGTSSKSSMQVASGTIMEAGDVFALNAALAAIPFNYYYSAKIIAPADWPSAVAGAIGWRLVSSDTLYQAWHQNNTVIGPIGLAALAGVVSGMPPNPIHDAILAGIPIMWAIHQETPGSVKTEPALSGSLGADLVGSGAKGLGDMASMGGSAASDAAKKAADQLLPDLGGGLGVFALGLLAVAVLGGR